MHVDLAEGSQECGRNSLLLLLGNLSEERQAEDFLGDALRDGEGTIRISKA
jgi:hypothetical protein